MGPVRGQEIDSGGVLSAKARQKCRNISRPSAAPTSESSSARNIESVVDVADNMTPGRRSDESDLSEVVAGWRVNLAGKKIVKLKKGEVYVPSSRQAAVVGCGKMLQTKGAFLSTRRGGGEGVGDTSKKREKKRQD